MQQTHMLGLCWTPGQKDQLAHILVDSMTEQRVSIADLCARGRLPSASE